jgi:hypothetical protein
MSVLRGMGILIVVLSFMVVTATSIADDKIELTNTATAELKVIVDGMKGSETINDQEYDVPVSTVGTASIILDDNLDGATESDIVAFQARRMVGIKPAEWTAGDDRMSIELEGEQGVGIVVWHLIPRDSRTFNRTIAASALAGQVWRDERMGLKLTSLEMYDVSSSAAVSMLKLHCDDKSAGCGDCERLLGAFPPTAGKVNVYYVEEVNFGDGSATTNGYWCGDSGDNVVVLGKDARCDLMSHEFGHTLTLAHVSSSDFDDRNMMWALSTRRRFYTEGQLFRAHVVDGSAINDTYGLRPYGAKHSCTTDLNCPSVSLRLWPE